MPNDVPPPAETDPEAIRRYARGVMDAFGLTDWSFAFDDAKRRLGACHHSRQMITMSRHFVDRNRPSEIRDTLLHEVAHALVGHGRGHGPIWKAMARRVGCRPERCARAEMPAGRWRAECPGCMRSFTRHQRPKKMTGWYCRACGREKGRLEWQMGEGT